MDYTAVLSVLAWLYTLALTGYCLWMRLNLPRPWWFKALNPASFWVFLPILILPLVGITISRPAYWLAATLGSVQSVVYFVRPMFPRRRPAPADGQPRLKVMTSNLFKHNKHVEGIIEAIMAESPDLLALQEVKPEHIEAIEQHLADTYPYRDIFPGPDCEGMGLLSRYPFLSIETLNGAPGANPTQVASIDVAGDEAWVVNMHPRIPLLKTKNVAGVPIPYDVDTGERQEDVERLLSLLEGLEGNTVLLGDMNTTDQCPEYKLIPTGWRDAYREVGWGLGVTYPVGRSFFGLRTLIPLFRIDHVFYTGDWQALAARTGKMPGSDHRYLVVEFARPCK